MLRNCSQCVYSYYNPRDLFPLRQCLKFSKKENGQTLYETSEQCRKEDSKCGTQGVYWCLRIDDSIYK